MESPHFASLPVVGQPGNDVSLELGSGCQFRYCLADQGLFSLMPQPMAKGDDKQICIEAYDSKRKFSFGSGNKNPIRPIELLLWKSRLVLSQASTNG